MTWGKHPLEPSVAPPDGGTPAVGVWPFAAGDKVTVWTASDDASFGGTVIEATERGILLDRIGAPPIFYPTHTVVAVELDGMDGMTAGE